MEKKKIKEAIVVEGRDDAEVVSRAYDAIIICTHGFGITRETWGLIEKAYEEKGIIVLTDPDFSGEEIRKRVSARFPEAKQAYIPREAAMKGDDIGVENATPDDVITAIESAHSTLLKEPARMVTVAEFEEAGLTGNPDSARKREHAAAVLGIGYGNGKTFLKKINAFGISAEELNRAVGAIEKKTK